MYARPPKKNVYVKGLQGGNNRERSGSQDSNGLGIIIPRVSLIDDSRPNSPEQQFTDSQPQFTDSPVFDEVDEFSSANLLTYFQIIDEPCLATNDTLAQSPPPSAVPTSRPRTRTMSTELVQLQQRLRAASAAEEPSSRPLHHSSGSLINFVAASDKTTNQFYASYNQDGLNSLWGDGPEYPDMQTVHDAVEKRVRDKLLGRSHGDISEDGGSLNTEELEELVEYTTASRRGSNKETEEDSYNVKKAAEAKLKRMKGLNDYVNQHTMRKILQQWNMIEQKFETSSISVTRRDKKIPEDPHSGKSTKALYVSDFALLLCNPKVKIKSTEFATMCYEFKLIDEEITHARKVAAAKFLIEMIASDPNAAKSEKNKINIHLQILQRTAEGVITLDQVTEYAFSKDIEKRKQEMMKILEGRDGMLQEIIDERRKKKEAQERYDFKIATAQSGFEKFFCEVQYSKGVLTISRLIALKSIIEHCETVVREANAERLITVPIDVLDLIGRDAFPESTVDASLNKAKDIRSLNGFSSSKNKLDDTKIVKNFLNGEFRIRLDGPSPRSTVITLVRMTIKHGKALNGYSYREFVEMFQAYASTRIQAFGRAYCMRHRFRSLRKIQRRILGACKRNNFRGWADLTRRNVDQRVHCWRPIKAWNFYIKCLKGMHNLFRLCFWPFHVWRRYACSTRTAKEKVKFLVTRVMPTYMQIKVYRAWHKYTSKQAERKNIADQYVKRRLYSKSSSSFGWWHRWAAQKLKIRRMWLKDGLLILLKHITFCKTFPFLVWRAYVFYKKQIRSRVQEKALMFRKFIFPRKTVRQCLTNAGKKERCVKQQALKQGKNNLDGDVNNDDEEKRKAESLEEDELYFDSIWPQKRPKSLKYRLKCEIDYDRDVPLVQHQEMVVVQEESMSFDGIKQKRKEIFVLRCNLKEPGNTVVDDIYYNNFNDLIEPEDLGFLSWTEEYIRDKCRVLHARAKEVEKLTLFENSMRYHRLMQRAYRNIKQNWIIRRNQRYAKEVLNFKRMEMVFGGFYRWMNRADSANIEDPNITTGMSKSEKLATEFRTLRLEKMNRRKLIIAALKASGNDTDDLDERGNKVVVKNSKSDPKSPLTVMTDSKSIIVCPLASPSSPSRHDDGASVGSSKNARKQKKTSIGKKKDLASLNAASVASSVNESISKASDTLAIIPSNILLLDRQDRAIETEHVDKILALSTVLVAEAGNLIEKADDVSNKLLRIKKLSKTYFDEICEFEERILQTAIANELSFAEEFKVWAADAMLELFVKINREVRVLLSKQVLRRCFRYLRLPVMEKIAITMMNRRKIQNWIRIVVRYKSIERKAEYYHNVRTKWVIFNRWLKFIEKENLDCTYGISGIVERRSHLQLGCHRDLTSMGFKPIIYYNNRRLILQTCVLSACFYRLLAYTQERHTFQMLEVNAAGLYRIRVLLRCFLSMKTLRSTEEIYEMSHKNPSSLEKRFQSDIEQFVKRFTSRRKRSTPFIIKKLSAVFTRKQKKEARNSLSFKNFVTTMKKNVSARLVSEQRIIVDAFVNKGRLDFRDFYGPPSVFDDAVPGSMGHVEGDHFSDPLISNSLYSGINDEVPGGYKITKMKVNVMQGLGIVGWQLFWGAHGAKEIKSKKRGKWVAGGGESHIHEIHVSPDDFVIDIEYYYEGTVIMGLRLKLFFEGWSPWVGGKTSASTLICRLGIDLVPRQEFEDLFLSAGSEDISNPGYPRTYVIGFTGIENAARATCPRLVVRKVISQHIFSYNWVQEGIDKHKAERKANDLTLDKFSKKSKKGHDDNNDEESSLSLEESSSSASISASISLPSIGTKSLTYREQRSIASHQSENNKQPPPVLHEISESEGQFFDVIRMRITEVRAAERRTLNLARNLWTSNQYRQEGHPMAPFTAIKTLAGLCTWYFNSICKRLVPVPRNEKVAFEMIEKSRGIKLRAEIQYRRGAGLQAMVAQANASVQPWDGKPILGPNERARKKIYMTKVANMELDAIKFLTEAEKMNLEADKLFKDGRALMPQLQLSAFVCYNYRRKLAASHQKASLLTVMDMNQLKQSLSGTTGRDFSLNENNLDRIRESCSNKVPELQKFMSLDEAVQGIIKEADLGNIMSSSCSDWSMKGSRGKRASVSNGIQQRIIGKGKRLNVPLLAKGLNRSSFKGAKLNQDSLSLNSSVVDDDEYSPSRSLSLPSLNI